MDGCCARRRCVVKVRYSEHIQRYSSETLKNHWHDERSQILPAVVHLITRAAFKHPQSSKRLWHQHTRMTGSYKLTSSSSSSHVSHCPPCTFCLAIMTVNATVGDDKIYARLRVRPYIHTCRSYAWPVQRCDMRGRRNRFVRFWASGGASGRANFPKMGDSLPRTPMNHVQNLTPLA